MKNNAAVTVRQPAPDCAVCGRSGTALVYLGLGNYRHEECAPGSPNWIEWYDAHPAIHSTAGDIIRASRN